MATTVLQSFQNSKLFDKSLIIEMNESPADVKDFTFKTKTVQPKDISYNQSQVQGKPSHQGSVASLESRSFADQSENQPLTDVHTCRYDECHKFRQTKTEKEINESPASPLKNAFLILVIILLILWIIIYNVLTQFKLL